MNEQNKEKGFIALYRSIRQWCWYDDLPTRTLFLDFLTRCNWKSIEWHSEIINPGEFITSIEHLAKDNKLSKSQVRTALKKLVSTNEIVIKTTNKYTKISVINYNSYQGTKNPKRKQGANKTQTDDNQATNGSQTDDNQIATIKQDNHLNHLNHLTNKQYSVFEKNVFDKYISAGLIQHKNLTPKAKKAIAKLKKIYSEEQILNAIERYGIMFNDNENEYSEKYCNYKWTLEELLLKEKGISEFMDEGGKWIRYSENIKQLEQSERNTRSKESIEKALKLKELYAKREEELEIEAIEKYSKELVNV